MPKVLQINVNACKGSTGRIVEQIGSLAIKNGWESLIAYGRDGGESKSQLYRIDNRWEVIMHGVKTLLQDGHCLASSNATKRLIDIIKQYNPDVIHLHNIHGYYLNMNILFDYLVTNETPVVWTLHDCWSYTGHCTYYSNIECERWKTECNHCPKKGNYPKSLFFDKSKKRFNQKKRLFTSLPNLTLVPVSHWLDYELKYSFLESVPSIVIPNGVDTSVFKPTEDHLNIRKKYGLEGKYVLLGVATAWGPHKGWNDFKKLSGLIASDCKIVMVGVSQDQAKDLSSNIIAIPRTESQEELAQLYSMADVVLNLSTQESFGLTTVEGFACGTPCVAYNCTASPELVTPETGEVVEYGDINGIVSAVNKLIKRGKNKYLKSCRDRAVKEYDMQNNFLRYVKLYESLICK